MKKIITGIFLTALFIGCDSGGTGSPKGVVAAFIEASKQGNLDEIKKYVTKSDAGLLEMGEKMMAQFDPKGAGEMKEKMANEFKNKTKNSAIEIKAEKIDGDKATVDVEFVNDGKKESRPFSLLKEEGIWKISLLSTGLKNAGVNGGDAADEMKSINIDSLKGAISKGMEEFNKIDKDSLKKVMEEAMKELDKLKDIPKKN